MTNLQEIKETVTFSKASEHFELPRLIEGSQDCPFCGRTHKLSVNGQYFRCFHPGCAKSGTVVDLLILTGQASDAKDAFRKLAPLVDGNNSDTYFKGQLSRSGFLNKALTLYQKALTDEVLEVLNQRGYAKSLEEIPFGFAPHSRYLQERGVLLADLVEHKLAYTSGQEFFSNRVVFPIVDERGNTVHLQGRSLDPEAEVRWLSTPTPDEGHGIDHYLFGANLLPKGPIQVCILSEGISDSLSILELDMHVLGTFGVEVDLLRHASLLERIENLVVMLDNDRYPLGTDLSGLYKSWTPMLKRLILLQERMPKLNIWCCPPPSAPGIKDVNNWVSAGNITPEVFAQYVRRHAQRLEEFAIHALGQRWEYQTLLLSLVGIRKSKKALSMMRHLASQLESDPIAYAINAIRSRP